MLGVQGAVAIVLWVVFLLFPTGETPVDRPTQPKMDSMALAHAANVLATDRERLEQELHAGLLIHDERAVGDFSALQAQAAELSLSSLQWRTLPAVDERIPVELILEVQGSYYNLPILVDGLYRQSHPMQITYLSVETPRVMVAHTEVTIRMRFHRPLDLASSSLQNRLQGLLGGLQSRAAEVALEEAARLSILERFAEHASELESASAENRTQVMTALPSMLRRLPSTALGWVGMEQVGNEMHLVTDPG